MLYGLYYCLCDVHEITETTVFSAKLRVFHVLLPRKFRFSLVSTDDTGVFIESFRPPRATKISHGHHWENHCGVARRQIVKLSADFYTCVGL